MSTFMAKAETIERRWFVIDAAGQPLGRTAVKAANILRGKHRPEFTPHADCGEYVIIINASKAVLTGRKLEQKYYRSTPVTSAVSRRSSTRSLWQHAPSSLWSSLLRECSLTTLLALRRSPVFTFTQAKATSRLLRSLSYLTNKGG